MANYKIISTNEDVQWPAYVSTIILGEQQMEKAHNVLEKALVTLEAYGGPHFTISRVKSAKRTAVFLYEINCDIMDNDDEIIECVAMILNEPWMKANSIAAASFRFSDDCSVEKLVMKRKKSIKYYKDNEMIPEVQEKVVQQLITDV